MKTASRRRTAPALLAILLALVCGTVVLAAPALAEEGEAAAPAAEESAPAAEVAPAEEAAPAEEEPAYSADVPPELASAHALLIDRETGLVLLDKGSHERCYPASTTKVMTALLTLENANLDDMVTVEEGDFAEVTWDSSIAYLKAGDVLSVRDLLAGLLIPSGNDAAYVLARYLGGGDWHAFVDMMNERAAQLGCTDTHFVNPCGLHDDDHYTTAADLALIFEEALKHPEFAEISHNFTWTLPETDASPARELEATDMMLDPESPVYMGDDVVASKTGGTLQAGRCLVTLAERDGRSLLGVVLGAPREEDDAGVAPSFYDMRELLEWGFNAWRTGEVVSVGDVVGSAEVTLSSDGDAVDAAATSSIVATVPTETTLADLTLVPTWSEALQAPVAKGVALGEVAVSLGDRDLGTVTASTAHAMELSVPDYVLWWVTSDPRHTAMVAGAAAGVLVVAGVVIALVVRARRRRATSGSHMKK